MEAHPLDNDGDHAAEVDLRGMRRFAFTRSSSSSRDAFSFGMSPRARSHRLISSDVQSSGFPVGSDSAGNTSVPQIDQAATAVTIPAKPRNRFLEFRARSSGVGILTG